MKSGNLQAVLQGAKSHSFWLKDKVTESTLAPASVLFYSESQH